MNFHAQSIAEVMESLQTTSSGLSHKDVEQRLKNHGLNVLPTSGAAANHLAIFFSQWKNPLIVILLCAGLVSGMLGDLEDMIIIFVIVFLNVTVGFFQEDKANQALKKLQSLVKYQALVMREGKKEVVESEHVVPGDILFLSAGDKVQADGRLIRSVDVKINEAPLTGEAVPVKKHSDALASDVVLADCVNMVYRGTTVTDGEATVVVTATGSGTEIGRIAQLVKKTEEEKTPLQKQLGSLARSIGWIVVFLASLLVIIGIFAPNAQYTIIELLQTAVVVAVAAIPEGLVISLTVVLAIGMQQMLKRKALTRRLVAAETLGSVSVICTDKTGTLTLGDMRVVDVVTRSQSRELALRAGVLCNNAHIKNPEDLPSEWQCIGDTTDIALVRAGMEAGLPKQHLDTALPRFAEIPFSSERKYQATAHHIDHTNLLYVKGAPEVILSRSSMVEVQDKSVHFTEKDRKFFQRTAEQSAMEGLRMLAVAYRKISEPVAQLQDADVCDLIFVGLIAIADPVRPDVRDTIRVCQRAGIRVIMLTGDHVHTARAIGTSLGIMSSEEQALEGSAVALMSDVELKEALASVHIFARVEPEHKLRIVRVLQSQGDVVAVTGDGVNDAPALKAADIGIAVGSGTDVAKETADIVLLDDSFTTIVSAVQEGRRLYHNIKKVVLYLIAGSLGEVVLIIGSIVAGLPLAVLPAQILWINIIEEAFPNMALAFDPADEKDMRDPPRKKGAPILDRSMKSIIAVIIIASNILLFSLFLYFLDTTQDITRTRTLMFVGLALSPLFFIYSVRSLRTHFWRMSFFDNIYLTGATLLGGLLLIAAIHVPLLQNLLHTVPLTLREWGIMLGFAFCNILLIEVAKSFLLIRKTYAS